MVNKSTNFKKGRKYNKSKGRNKKDDKSIAGSEKKPKAGRKPETECFYCNGTGHWKHNCPKYLADKKNGKINKGIYDIHVIDVYLTSSPNSAWVFDTGSIAHKCNSKRG
jgi:hypothetical protein